MYIPFYNIVLTTYSPPFFSIKICPHSFVTIVVTPRSSNLSMVSFPGWPYRFIVRFILIQFNNAPPNHAVCTPLAFSTHVYVQKKKKKTALAVKHYPRNLYSIFPDGCTTTSSIMLTHNSSSNSVMGFFNFSNWSM